MADDLCFTPATELARLLHAGELSAREVLAAHLEQIERVNPAVNAIVTLVPDRAEAAAQAADDTFARGGLVGPLHGLPIAHKDLALTAGIRTTKGSPIFADHVPDEDELFVERIRTAGAIVLGKTNTPEFGTGSHTFNPVFGLTRNPYDLRRSAGGSSGGAAAALACGLVPIADGSDLGGSLRNPASFCNVVGFRPTPGRVPSWPSDDPDQAVGVEGPMGRTVADAALLLSAMAGPDPRVPISLLEPGSDFAPPFAEVSPGVAAWAPDAAGTMPFDPEVVRVVEGARSVFETLGWRTEPAFPDLSAARRVFLVERARIYLTLSALLDDHPGQMKASVVWNIEEGRRLTAEDLIDAQRSRASISSEMAAFFERFDVLVMPVAQVPPFDADLEYPAEVDGHPMGTHLDWMESCWCISVTGSPAISVPCGFTADGLPVGVQIVGRPGEDLRVLQAAQAFEAATGVGLRRPPPLGVPR
jgi:amidase